MIPKMTILAFIFVPIFAFASVLPTSKISLEVKQAGVRDVIENMLKSSELKYEIDSTVTNSMKVSIEAKSMKWSYVFKNILDQSKLAYRFDEAGKIHIIKR